MSHFRIRSHHKASVGHIRKFKTLSICKQGVIMNWRTSGHTSLGEFIVLISTFHAWLRSDIILFRCFIRYSIDGDKFHLSLKTQRIAFYYYDSPPMQSGFVTCSSQLLTLLSNCPQLRERRIRRQRQEIGTSLKKWKARTRYLLQSQQQFPRSSKSAFREKP